MLLSSGWCPGRLSDVPYFTQRLTEVWRAKQGCHLYPDQARPAALPAFKRRVEKPGNDVLLGCELPE